MVLEYIQLQYTFFFFPFLFFAIEDTQVHLKTGLVHREGVRKVFARSVIPCNSCGSNDEEGGKQNDRH